MKKRIARIDPILLTDTDKAFPAGSATGFFRYSHFEELAEGGVARIQQCVDLNLSRVVAMKRLHEHLQGDAMEERRFLREARVTSQIQHPNTVPVYELGRDKMGALYFTMKKVEGVDLREIIAALNEHDREAIDEYPLEVLVNVFLQTCLAIAFAHSRGVVHRDLKPANVLVGPFNEVVVLDWGLAKVHGEEEEPEGIADPHLQVERQTLSSHNLALTQAGRRYGTPLYMSPEQARGDADIDERTDVYNLGIVLYEILTLKNVVWGTDLNAVLEDIQHQVPPAPCKAAPRRSIPPELEAICMHCLEKDPQARYPSVNALIDDVGAWQQERRVSVLEDGMSQRIWKWRRRHLLSTTSLVAFVLGLLFGLLAMAASGSEPTVAEKNAGKARGSGALSDRLHPAKPRPHTLEEVAHLVEQAGHHARTGGLLVTAEDRTPEAIDQRKAARILWQFAGPDVAWKALEHATPAVRWWAVIYLDARGLAKRSRLHPLLEDPDPNVAAAVAETLEGLPDEETGKTRPPSRWWPRSGAGTARLPDGSVYEGSFRKAVFHGEGSLRWRNGDHYRGGFHNGLLHGQGTLAFSTGGHYEGGFEDGEMQGRGTLVVDHFSTYTGEFLNGLYHGQGRIRYDNGNRYKGGFAYGDFEGQGKLTYNEAEFQEGVFKDGLLEGQGVMEQRGLGRYEGGFKAGIMHGKGTLVFESGDVYQGAFVEGRMEGKGDMQFTDGGRYTGSFRKDLMHGRGVLTLPGGEVISGRWVDGEIADEYQLD